MGHDSQHPAGGDVRQVQRPARPAAEGDQERIVEAEVVHHRGHVAHVEGVGSLVRRGRGDRSHRCRGGRWSRPEVSRQVGHLPLPLLAVDDRETAQHHHRLPAREPKTS